MRSTRATRPIPLALTALVACFSALAALAVSGGMNMAQAHGKPSTSSMAMPMTMSMTVTHAAPELSQRSVALHDDLRRLWEEHVMWTRLAIISLEGSTPDTNATVARLLRNQVDLGNAIKPYYGSSAGNALTRELKSHILIAADLIAAAKAGDKAKVASAQARWVKNADEIAAFLHQANPEHWPLAVLKDEMHMHLKLTTDEAVAHLQGKWNADVAAYDRVEQHILHMSDLLADGIVAQFPSRFS